MKKVLVVDDLFRFGPDTLIPLPEGFVGASTLFTAFQKFNAEHWDHVITDLHIPVIQADRSGLPDRTPETDRVLQQLGKKFDTTTLCTAYKARRDKILWGGNTFEKIEWVLGQMARKPVSARNLEGNGLVLVEACWARSIPFTVYTEKWGHTQYSIVALATNGFVAPEQVAEVLTEHDKEYSFATDHGNPGGYPHYRDHGPIVISSDKSFAMGPKANPENWKKLFETI